jgi:ribose transport system ATP-binding protein
LKHGGRTGTDALRVANVSKSFSGRPVLRNVNLSVGHGQLRGLIGNNGAGKSTLVKLVTGVYTAGTGRIVINGHDAVGDFGAHAAREFGVRVVHQEAPLIDTFTVDEMVGIFHQYPTQLGRIRWRDLRRETERLLSLFNINVSPGMRISRLRAAERALVTLAIALADLDEGRFAPLLILDEATASVPAEEARTYLEAVRTVAANGGGVLMVSHRVQEIVDYCDSVTVLSDGQVVYDGPTDGMSVRDLHEYMKSTTSGEGSLEHTREATMLPPAWRTGRTGDDVDRMSPLLQVTDLRGPLVDGISFSVRAGEILGMSGLFGSGVSEAARLIAGIDVATGGTMQFSGEPPLVLKGRPHRALRSGIAYLSPDRAHEGGVAVLSMQENLVLPTVSRFWGKKAAERSRALEAISLFDIRPRNREVAFGTLSGGNQQKVLLARLLLTDPRLVVLDDPTVGVDPQSREVIFSVLREVVSLGRAALVVSSEPDQLARICNRVLIIDRGRITSELVGEQVTGGNIALASS